MTSESAQRRGRDGFTLIELLVVLGIIIILIGLLIPVISSVRKQARTASTRAEMSRIQSALTSYYADNKAYPGPFAEDQVHPINATTAVEPPTCPDPKTGTPLTGLVGAHQYVTSTENLFLGLEGGINFTTTGPAFVYDPTKVKLGPSSLNPLLPKQHVSYLDFGDDETTITSSTDAASGMCSNGNNPLLNGVINSPAAAADSAIPEFIDHFTPAMPILYLRARAGRTGIVTTPASAGVQQYDVAQLAPYNFTVSTSDYPQGSNPDSITTYFANPAVATSPRGKDGYILISAGQDGIFGTADDILVSN